MWQHQLGMDTGHGQEEACRTVPHGVGQSTRRARGCTVTGQNSGKDPEEDESRCQEWQRKSCLTTEADNKLNGCQRGRGGMNCKIGIDIHTL